MNMGGKNGLACTTGIREFGPGTIPICPLPHMPVINDLVPDLTQFDAQHAAFDHLQNAHSTDGRAGSNPSGASRLSIMLDDRPVERLSAVDRYRVYQAEGEGLLR